MIDAFALVLGIIGKIGALGAQAASDRAEDKAQAIASLQKIDAALDVELSEGAVKRTAWQTTDDGMLR